MVKLINVTFDGKAFIPEEVPKIPVNAKCQVRIEIAEPEPNPHVRPPWLQVALEAQLEGPPDLAENFGEYRNTRFIQAGFTSFDL